MNKIWDKGVGAYEIYFQDSSQNLILSRYDTSGHDIYFYTPSGSTPTGHEYYIQIAWSAGATPNGASTPKPRIWIGTDGATPVEQTVNAGTDNSYPTGAWYNDSVGSANIMNYSANSACPSSSRGYNAAGWLMVYRQYNTNQSASFASANHGHWYYDKYRGSTWNSTYRPSNASVDLSTWAVSGGLITNTGSNTGSGYNGHFSSNKQITLPSGHKAWKFTSNTDYIWIPNGSKTCDLDYYSAEIAFYLNGTFSGASTQPRLFSKRAIDSATNTNSEWCLFVDTPNNRLQLQRFTTDGNWDAYYTSGTPVTIGNWYDIQISYDAMEGPNDYGIAIFINGTQQTLYHFDTGTGDWMDDCPVGSLIVGNIDGYWNNNRGLDGTIAVFRWYNYDASGDFASNYAADSAIWATSTVDVSSPDTNTLTPTEFSSFTIHQTSKEMITLKPKERNSTQISGGDRVVNTDEVITLSITEKSYVSVTTISEVTTPEIITLIVTENSYIQKVGCKYVTSTETAILTDSDAGTTQILPTYFSDETATLSVSETNTFGFTNSEVMNLSVRETSSFPKITSHETINLRNIEGHSLEEFSSSINVAETDTLIITETSDINIIYVPTQEPPITVPYTLEVRQRNPGWQVVNGGAPAACSSAPGRDDVFFSSKVDGEVMYITSADGYESALDLQGMIVSSVSAVSPAENQIFVFAQGLTRAVYYKGSIDGGKTWGEWMTLGGTLAANAGPSVCMDADGKINVFAVGKGNALFHLKGTPGTAYLQPQSISFDGTYYYYVTTWSIYKLDQSMNVVMYRENVGTLCGGDHLGGAGLNNGILYCFCTTQELPQKEMVGLFNTSDLSFITNYDLCELSGLTYEVLNIGGVGVDAENNCLVAIQYGTSGSTALGHTKVFKFNLDTFAYEGSITGDGPAGIYYQGICPYNGKYYYSTNENWVAGETAVVGVMNPNGSSESIIITYPDTGATTAGLEVEGLCTTDAGISVIVGGDIYTFSGTYPYTLLDTHASPGVPAITSPSSWQQLGGAASSSPAACYYETGICVFVRGTDGACWYRWSADNTTWHPWYSLGGSLHPGTGPAAVSMTSGRVDLYCVGSDNSIWTKTNTSSNWTTSGAWVNIGGPVTSTLAAASNNENEITLFGRGQDGALWYTEWTPASVGIAGWSKWAKLINRAFNYIGVLDGRIAPQVQQELGNADLLTFNLNIDSPLVPALSGNPKGYEIWWYGRDNQFKQAFVLQKVEAYGDFGGVQGSGGSTLGAGSGYNLLVTADGPEEYLNRYNIAFEYKSSQRMTLQVLQDISTEILNDGFITGIYVDPTLNMPLDVDLSWETIKTGIDKIIQQTGGYCRVYIPPSDPSKRILTLASTFAAIQNSYDPVNVTNAAQVIYDYFPSQGLLIPNDGGVAGADGDGVASSPGYYELTNNGAPAWQFQDTTDYIVIPDVPELENLYNFTFQAIFRIDAAGATNYSYIYSKGGFVIAWVDSSARILVQRTTTGTGSGTMDQYIMSTTGTVNIGQWNYIQIAWDGSLGPGIGVPVMYLNGTKLTITHSKTGTGAWASDLGEDIYIGNDVTLANNSAMTLSFLSLHSTALGDVALKAEYAANKWREGVNSESSEVEYSTWPTTGTTIINKGNAGAAYNATAQQPDYEPISSGAGMWAFNGATDYIEAPHGGAIDNTSATTFEFLFNLNETSTAGRLWSKQQQLGPWEVWIDENNQCIVTSRTTANSDQVTYTTPVNSIALGTWYDLQIVWPSSPAVAPSIYLNNTQQTLSKTSTSAASSWSNDGWMMLNGTGPAACSWGSGRKDIFMVGANATVSHTWDDGNGGTGLENLGGTLTTTPAATSPAANTIHLFGRGSNGYCYYNKWNGTSWSGWVSLGGTLYPNAGLTACSYGSRIDVFVEGGTAGSLYQKTSTNGGSSWSGWVHLTGATIYCGPTAVATDNGDITIFAQGSDGTLWSMEWNGSSWSTWATVGGSVIASNVAPSACVTSDGYIAVCVIDSTGAAWIITTEGGFVQGSQQGLAWDGAYFYYITTTAIYKLDSNLNVVASNLTAAADCGGDHMGDGAVYDGKLYGCCVNAETMDAWIATWDTSTLAQISSFMPHEPCGSVTVNTVNNTIVDIDLAAPGTGAGPCQLFTFDLTTNAYIATINPDSPLWYTEGMDFYGGHYYTATAATYDCGWGNMDPTGGVFMMNTDGTGVTRIIPYSAFTHGGELEGVDVKADYIRVQCGGFTYLFNNTTPYALVSMQTPVDNYIPLGGSLNAQPAIIAPSTLELDAYINQNTQLYTNTSTDDGNTWGDWTIDGDFNIYLGNNKAQTNNLNCSLALYREHSSALSADQLSNNYNSDQWILYGSYNPSGFHTDQPPIITIGKNATGVDVQSDYSSIITKLYPRGAGSAPGELTLNSPPYFQPMVRLKNPTIVDQYVYFSVEPDNEYVSYNNFEMGVSPRSAGMLIGRGRKNLGAYTAWNPVAHGADAAAQAGTSDPPWDLPATVGGYASAGGTRNEAAAQMFNIPQGGAQITDISLLLWRIDPSKTKGLVNQSDLLEYTRLIEETGGAIKFCVGIYNSIKQDKTGVLEPYQGPLLWYVGDFFSIASDNFRWYNFPLQGAWLATGSYWVVISLYPSSVAFSNYLGGLECGGYFTTTNPGFDNESDTQTGIKHNAWAPAGRYEKTSTYENKHGYYNLDVIINEINTDVTDQFFFVDEKTIGIIASNYIPTDEYYVAYPLAPWLSNQDAIDKYGMIEGTYKDDTATSQDALLKSGTQYLTKVSQPILSWSVGVVDLYDLNPTINWSEELKLGTNVLVMDEKLGVNELCMISKLQKTNLDTPHDIQLTLDAIYKNTPRLLAETMGDLQDKPKYEGGQVVATPYTLTTQADTNNPAWFEFEIRPSTTRVHSVEFSLNSQPFQAAGTGGLTTGSATSASGHVIEIDGTTVNSLSGECGSIDILPFLTLNHAGTPTPGWHYIKVTPPKG
jgi:hypothetical protein